MFFSLPSRKINTLCFSRSHLRGRWLHIVLQSFLLSAGSPRRCPGSHGSSLRPCTWPSVSPAPRLGRGTAGFTASTSLFPTKEKHFIKKASRLLAFYVGQNLCKRFHMVRVIAGNSWKSSNQRKTTRIPSPLSSPHPLSENPGSLFSFLENHLWETVEAEQTDSQALSSG